MENDMATVAADPAVAHPMTSYKDVHFKPVPCHSICSAISDGLVIYALWYYGKRKYIQFDVTLL